MLQIRTFTPDDAGTWNNFVRTHPQGTLFHLIEWKRVVEQTFGHRSHYLIVEQNGHTGGKEVAGILPLFEIKSRLFGHSLVSVPFAEKGGLLAETPEAAGNLLDQASAFAAEHKAEYVELRNTRALDKLPTKDLYVSFRKAIAPDPDENLRAIPRKQRRMVRQGLKNGLKAVFGHEHLPAFYRMLAINFHRLGTPIFPYKLFGSFIDHFADQASVMIVQDPEGRTIAGVMSFYYQDAVLPYYAGSLPEYRHLAPNDFMYWALMEHAREKGCTCFDFGRSKVETGSYKFKKHWGFEPEPLAYQYILNTRDTIPNISPSNPKYQRRIELWRKLPLWTTKVIGPRIAKYLC